MLNRIEKYSWGLLVTIPILIGIAFRIIYYSHGCPFWNDESALALNILNKSFLELWGELDWEQVSPPLFNCFAKFVFLFKSFSLLSELKTEYFLKLPSLICSIAAIFLFWKLTQKIIENKVGQFFALTLFCINYRLIDYAQELKSYSSDVMVFIAILLSYFYIDFSKIKKSLLILLAAAYGIVIWYSYTAIFAITSIAVLLAIKNFKEKKKLCLLFLPFAVSLLIFYVCRNSLNSNEYLHTYWSIRFINYNFSNFFTIIKDLVSYYFFYFNAGWLIYLMLIGGLAYIFKNIKKETSLILSLPLFITIILSYLNIYPFGKRIALYFFPVFLLLICKTFDLSFLKNKILTAIISLLIIMYIVIEGLINDYSSIINRKYYIETTPQLLKIAEQSMEKDDVLYVLFLTRINYAMYKDTVNIQNVIIEKNLIRNLDTQKQVLDSLPSGKSYYILMTHTGDKPELLQTIKEYIATQQEPVLITDKDYNTLAKFYKK